MPVRLVAGILAVLVPAGLVAGMLPVLVPARLVVGMLVFFVPVGFDPGPVVVFVPVRLVVGILVFAVPVGLLLGKLGFFVPVEVGGGILVASERALVVSCLFVGISADWAGDFSSSLGSNISTVSSMSASVLVVCPFVSAAVDVFSLAASVRWSGVTPSDSLSATSSSLVSAEDIGGCSVAVLFELSELEVSSPPSDRAPPPCLILASTKNCFPFCFGSIPM